MKKKLIGNTLEQLREVAAELGLPAFAARQLAGWLYGKKADSFDRMTDLSRAAREKLALRYEIGRQSPVQVQVSADGTKKYLFPCHTGGFIESVMIPDGDRSTLCVSSQAGCRMGCKFCMTGRQGFSGHLEPAEIISQFLDVAESDALTNAVFMGMGEPLDNVEAVLRSIEILTADWGFAWSPKRITLSTIGVTPALKRFLDESRAHLAVSLHNPFPDQRQELMPMEKAYPIEKTLELIRQYDFTGQRRVSFEYIMFDRLNDTKKHADALVRLLRGLECRVNLIRFHSIPDSPLAPSPVPVIGQFRDRLNAGGLIATVRASRGEDILAACGMLSGKKSASENRNDNL